MLTIPRSIRAALAAGLVAAGIAATPGAALANDAYLSYPEYQALNPGSLTIGVEDFAMFGIERSQPGTVLSAGAAGNPFSTSALFYELSAGQDAIFFLSPATWAFGFSYETQGFLQGEVAFSECFGFDGGPGACPLASEGFFGGGRILPVEVLAIRVQAVTDGQIVMGDFQIAGDMSTVPEPGTVALLGTGVLALGGFGAFRRRREQASRA